MQPNESQADDGHPAGPRIDPAIEWAFGPASALYVVSDGKAEWLTVLLQLRETSAGEFRSLIEERIANASDQVIRIPDLYAEPPAGLKDSPYCTALITQRFLDLLMEKDDPLKDRVARITLGAPLSPEGRSRPRALRS